MEIRFKIKPLSIQRVERKLDQKSVEKNIGKGVGKELIEFWNSYGEVSFSNGIVIYEYNLVHERNQLYEIHIYSSNYLLIGDDGGGRGLFIKYNDNDLILYYLDLGAIGSSEFNSTRLNFIDWLEKSSQLDEEENESDDLVIPITLNVVKEPSDILKFIMEVRRIFNITTPVSELKEKLKNPPFELIDKITLTKYKKDIEILNKKYNCLQVTSSTDKKRIIINP